jgi:hypothetical protein
LNRDGVLSFDAVFHPITGALDEHRLGVMQQPIKHRSRNGAIPIEDGRPLLEGFVGGQNDRAPLVALANDLEEQVGAALVDGQVTDLVQNERGRRQVPFQFGFERPAALGGAQGVDDVDGIGE